MPAGGFVAGLRLGCKRKLGCHVCRENRSRFKIAVPPTACEQPRDSPQTCKGAAEGHCSGRLRFVAFPKCRVHSVNERVSTHSLVPSGVPTLLCELHARLVPCCDWGRRSNAMRPFWS